MFIVDNYGCTDVPDGEVFRPADTETLSRQTYWDWRHHLNIWELTGRERLRALLDYGVWIEA